MQHFDEQPTKTKIKLHVNKEFFYFSHLVKRSHYHLLQHTSEINSFCLNVPAEAHALDRHYTDATQVCFAIFSGKLLIMRQNLHPWGKPTACSAHYKHLT